MDKYAKAFIKASLIYLGIGVILGVLMVMWPDTRSTLSRVHTHVNLLGFMAMMIYGVGYHILPDSWEDRCIATVSEMFKFGWLILHSLDYPSLG
jgi:hypothetical protein